MTPRRSRAVLLLCCCALQTHCATGPGAQPAREQLTENAYPGSLVDSTALPGVFYQQRIEARLGERTMSFAAVLQSDAGVLSLLALTPYGTRAFLLEQHGQRVRYANYVDRELPFPPRFILIDVHRTLFLGLPGAPRKDGSHAALVRGERVVESWRGGYLHERTFERQDGRPAGLIRIRYLDGGMRDGVPPQRIELDNGWFGYQLTIHTLTPE